MGVGNKRTLTKTRRHLRDLDQVKADMLSPKHLAQYQDTKLSEDLPGLGKWYCTECAKWYDTEASLVGHRKGKPHKRRVKQLREEPYTQKEAEAVVGIVTDNEGHHRRAEVTDAEMEITT
ncbi:putative zinc finger protein [Eutypa lata UCREL1]|uniref:Putative zinc finger protein n=1 Tax=Eutypa lata (strain UCR-EL1) TaxID=1287681 RepID=M7SLP8_EUTLA|nr:putative zinc finger protein [Eutypa lata UCREL1]